MKGLILNEGEEYYSKFAKVFGQILELQYQYNWLISDSECYPSAKYLQNKLNCKYYWISGQELAAILISQDFQWIWGVFSGFKKGFELADILKYSIPFANGYDGYWNNPLTIQHPLAEIEIVAWDSKCSLFISKNDNILSQISIIYPQAKSLEQYNNCEIV